MLASVIAASAGKRGFAALAPILMCLPSCIAPEDIASTDSELSIGTRPTSVVWILLDACRADHLSCYGYERNTSPNIDALAKRGTLFERNYAQAPNTLLSVPTYMTGRFEPVFYQDERHLNIWFLRTPPKDEVLISKIFSENDFDTAMFSASPWYSEGSRLGRSFDDFGWLRHQRNVPTGTFEDRNPELFQWLSDHADRPFFLYVHALDTHSPRYENNTHKKWLDPSFPKARDTTLRRWQGAPYSTEDQDHIRNLYDGGISYADETVGEVIDRLKALGIFESTLIIISSDHGEILGQDGKTLGHPASECYDDLLHTPLIVAGPGIPSNVRVGTKTQNADIVPTLVELLSLETDAKFDGQSLMLQTQLPDAADSRPFAYARTQAFMTNSELNRILIYDDMKFDISALENEQMALANNPTRRHMEIWAMPDAIGTRTPVNASPLRTAAVENIVRNTFIPLWKAKEALPKVIPSVFFIDHGKSMVPDAITRDDDPKDQKWHRPRQRLLGNLVHEDDFLMSYAWMENAPGLVFGAAVPNGIYEVSVFSRTHKVDDVQRGSSFRFLVRPEKDWRLFELDPLPTGGPNKKWFDLGTYTVTDGSFVYWVDEGNEDDISIVGSLKFVQAGADISDIPTAKDLEDEYRRLEGLGYIN